MTGFRSPGHTDVPNELFDEMLATMSNVELRVTLVAIRQTLGWHRKKHPMSISYLQQKTGLSRQGVLNGLEQAIARGTIVADPTAKRGDTKVYALIVDDEPVTSQLSVHHGAGSQLSRLPVVNSVDQSAKKVVNSVDTIKEKDSKKGSKEKSVYTHAPATAPISSIQPATPDQIDPQPIVTEKEFDLSASIPDQSPQGSGASPLTPPAELEPRKLCRTCKQTKPIANFVDPGTGRQYAAKCNACRAEDVAIKRAVDAKIAADDAANPPPLEVVRKHPLWVAYRDAIIDASAKLHGVTDALDLDPSKSQVERYAAILDKLQAQGTTPETLSAYVRGKMQAHARQSGKPPVYPFLWLDTDAPQLKFVKVVTPHSSTPALDWSTADGCIAIAENAQNAPETRVKALNKLRAYMTPWDVDSAQIERISAMLSRVSDGDLEQAVAA